MEEKAGKHKKDKLIEDNFLQGNTNEKKALMKGISNNREKAAVFQVYDPQKDTYETRAFYKKTKKTNKE